MPQPQPPLSADASTAVYKPDVDVSSRTRLHITPFNPSLLEKFVPASVLPLATGISYHSVETFPEKGFGYVEVPAVEAQKMKKKLNGSILKGTKVRIEDARPEKRRKTRDDGTGGVAETDGEKRESKRVKKNRREEGVLPGVELPKERHVKRGWTEPVADGKGKKGGKDKVKGQEKDREKKAEASKYTKDSELLFRTNLPPNMASATSAKERKSKDKVCKMRNHQIVVHEFAKTTKHAGFLKGSQVPKDGKLVTQYVDGKGWIDEEGNVVEAESEARRRKRKRTPVEVAGDAEDDSIKTGLDTVASVQEENTGTEAPVDKKSRESEEKDQVTSSANTNMNGTPKARNKTSVPAAKPVQDDDSKNSEESSDESLEESSSAVSSESPTGNSDDDGNDEENASSASEAELDNSVLSKKTVAAPDAASTPLLTHPASSKPDETPPPEQPKEVHPLEALFKRPKLPDLNIPAVPAPIDTSFCFFDAEAEDDDVFLNPPQTPYTRQDLRSRSIRSAAPTPDTAAIGRKFSFPPWAGEENAEDDGEERDGQEGDVETGLELGEDAMQGAERPDQGKAEGEGPEKPEKPESEFAKWFWEHRGETNRAWRKRRREVLKVKRQRENKRLGRRVV